MKQQKNSDGRAPDQMRPVHIERGCSPQAEGSALVSFGDTRVLCTASLEDRQPPWLRGTPRGWVTAEYAMLPRATATRTNRERRGISGRSQEIERLIGRALRQAVSLEALRGYTLTLDCDVLNADGGTRTAAITGACVALAEAIGAIPDLAESPFRRLVSAVSVGVVEGVPVLDMDYARDSVAEVDLNLVLAEDGEVIELQATGERSGFNRSQLDQMMDMGTRGCEALFEVQRRSLEQ